MFCEEAGVADIEIYSVACFVSFLPADYQKIADIAIHFVDSFFMDSPKLISKGKPAVSEVVVAGKKLDFLTSW